MTANEPRQIAFDDIRKGDRIEAAWSVGDREEAYRGVADYLSSHGTWCTEEGMLLAERGAEGEGGTITLLHRPAVTEPKGLGAVVRARVPASGGGLWTFVQVRVEQGLAPWQGPGTWRFYWSNFYPESIKVLSEGIEVES